MKLKEKDIQVLLEKTNDNMKLRRLSDETISAYDYALKSFFKNCDYKGKLEDFKEEDLVQYMKKQFLTKECSHYTYNQHLAAIKKMFVVCYRKVFIDDLIPRAKIKKKLPVIVSKKDFLTILNNEKDLKHKCWLLLSFCCGLRRFEVATLKIENIHSEEGYLLTISKGGDERKTVLPLLVVKFLRLYYVKKKMTQNEGYLFKGNKNNKTGHISEETVGGYFTNLNDPYKLGKDYTYHSLRHSFATYFIMNGGRIEELQVLLGHKNIATTAIYLHLALNFKNLKGINYHE